MSVGLGWVEMSEVENVVCEEQITCFWSSSVGEKKRHKRGMIRTPFIPLPSLPVMIPICLCYHAVCLKKWQTDVAESDAVKKSSPSLNCLRHTTSTRLKTVPISAHIRLMLGSVSRRNGAGAWRKQFIPHATSDGLLQWAYEVQILNQAINDNKIPVIFYCCLGFSPADYVLPNHSFISNVKV